MPPKRSVEDEITDRVAELTNGDSKSGKSNPNGKTTKKDGDEKIGGIGFVDILRVLTGLLVVSAGMSYMVTGGSYTWGYSLSTYFSKVKNSMNGPLELNDLELLSFNGNDPSKPLYVAINGTIYDVSAGRRMYGPGGSYSFFAGRDGARAFVTGCFDTDITPDLRGVEEMFLPIDWEEAEAMGREVDPAIKAQGPTQKLSKGEEKKRREREMREAKSRVKKSLGHWEAMFRGEKGKEYFVAGTIKRPTGVLELLPKRTLCEAAQKQRPIRGAKPTAGVHV